MVSTYHVFFAYELFRGAVTRAGYEASNADLTTFIRARLAVQAHLAFLLGWQAARFAIPVVAVALTSVEAATVHLDATE